jgi:NAD dependent epimerase/dehydratase family enzyme
VTNRELMRAVREACGAPFGLSATRWMLELGAFFLRTETELIIKSRRVAPARLLAGGFTFQFPQLPPALEDLCGTPPTMNGRKSHEPALRN